jgi:hypothetical protein
MATLRYTAKVKENRILELPEEAQSLGLKPGDEVCVSIDVAQVPTPNEKGLAIMRAITERHKGRPHTDGSNTLRLLREARAGAMYGYDPTDE